MVNDPSWVIAETVYTRAGHTYVLRFGLHHGRYAMAEAIGQWVGDPECDFSVADGMIVWQALSQEVVKYLIRIGVIR